MSQKRRMVVIGAVVCCLAVVAGVMAVRAFAAGVDVYCQSCTLHTNGVPASSGDRWTFQDNTLDSAVDILHFQIYMYNVNNNLVKCSLALDSNFLYNPCAPPSGMKWQARCHTLQGDGPADFVDCNASYSGNG